MRKSYMLAAVAALTIAASPAAAQALFSGSTAGCFGAACDPVTGASVNGGLTFTGGTFNQSTDSTGFLALGGLSDGLGTFSLTGLADTYTGDVFRLRVTFTSPVVTPNSTLFDTVLQGTVTGVNSGGVFVNFDNAVRTFGSGVNSFTFALNDVSISSNSAAQIVSGQIQQAAVPEPASWAMMIGGFGLIGGAMRRRKTAKVSFV